MIIHQLLASKHPFTMKIKVFIFILIQKLYYYERLKILLHAKGKHLPSPPNPVNPPKQKY